MHVGYEVKDSRRGVKHRVGYFTSYPTRREWNNCLLNLNHWISESKRFFTYFSPASLLYIRIYKQFIQTILLCTTAAGTLRPHSCLFFCLIFRTGIEAFARFTEYQIYNYWKWFVLWWWTQEAKNFRIDSRLSLTKWRCI